jgi:DNA helicase-2/ATP-dependent DNA helicase PcrA
MQSYLAPILSKYKLSATHVNTFIDVAEGGPQHFLLNTLLRFPSGMAAPNCYGVAVHGTLQRAHDHVRATGKLLPEEDLLREFEKRMQDLPFSDDDRRRYTQRGIDALRAYLKANGHSFTAKQYSELDFARQDVLLNGMHLTGKLDVVEFDKEQLTARVTDYKTGAALTSWDKGDEFKKIKAHKYRQQLMFYKLLIEHSRDWHDYRMSEGILQFVEPTASGEIVGLTLSDISDDEMDRFKQLITAVWRHITTMDFPDVSDYSPDYKGIVAFEEYLLTH